MTITTTESRLISQAAQTAGIKIITRHPLPGTDNKYLVTLDDVGDPAQVMTAFLGALFAADPQAVVAVGRVKVDAQTFAARMQQTNP